MAGFFSVSFAVLSLLSAVVSLLAARAARAEAEFVEDRLHSLESAAKSTKHLLESQAETMEQLANRVKMQRVRNATNHVADKPSEPDPYKDPDAWRQAMNRRLHMKVPPA